MAFIVETGAGLADANAYLSVADFKSYHDDRGNVYTGSNDTAISQAIVQATDYIERRFGPRFVGVRASDIQALSWPREDAVYPDGREALNVPKEVGYATAEYAFRALTAPLAPDPAYDTTNGAVIEREERAGPIVERYKFGNGGMTSTFRSYPAADSLLAELCFSSSFLWRV